MKSIYIYPMKRLKLYLLTAWAVMAIGKTFAQDTAKNKQKKSFIALETPPQYSGGVQSFSKFILKHLKYPDVAKIIGLNGNVYISFVVDTNGAVTNVAPVSCLGAGCTSEAVRVISMSPNWQPGFQDGKPVRVMYTVPINFTFNPDTTYETPIKKLRQSDYGFVFFIKGSTYSLDETEAKFGKSFNPIKVEDVEEYDNPKYADPGKKAVYLIVMKDS
jgi:hypothetical protein